ncbi:MAG: hypothetical protein P8Y27_10970 [Chromatiaceae bacterium]
MKVPFRGRSVAEEGDGHLVALAVARGVADAHRMGDLGRHGDRDGQVMGVLGNGPALVVAAVVEQDLGKRHPPPDGAGELPKGGDEPVVVAQGRQRADLGCLLAAHRGEGTDPALALQPEHALIEAAGKDHDPMDTLEQVILDLGLQGFVQIPRLVQNGQVVHPTVQRDRLSGHFCSSVSA